MAIPDYQSVMLPLLKLAESRNEEISTGEAVEALASQLNLKDEDIKQMLPSGIQPTFVNRVGWAATYMKKAGLLEPTRRGYYRITRRGQDLLKQNLQTIDVKILKQYPEFQQFQSLKGTRGSEKKNDSNINIDLDGATPSEALEKAYENLRDTLAEELLEKNKKSLTFIF